MGVMGKNRQPPALQKMKCLSPWALYFFDAPTTTLCLVRCLATTPRRKKGKEKSNQDFMNPFEAHSPLFLLFELGLQHQIIANVAKLEQFVMVHHLLLNDSGRKCSHYFAYRPPLAVTKPSELAAAESHSQSHCSLQMGGAICMNIQKTVTKA